MRTGSEPIYAREGVLAFLRRDELDSVLVVLNNTNAPQKLSLPTGSVYEEGVELQDQLSDSHFLVQQQQIPDLTIPAMSAMILV